MITEEQNWEQKGKDKVKLLVEEYGKEDQEAKTNQTNLMYMLQHIQLFFTGSIKES